MRRQLCPLCQLCQSSPAASMFMPSRAGGLELHMFMFGASLSPPPPGPRQKNNHKKSTTVKKSHNCAGSHLPSALSARMQAPGTSHLGYRSRRTLGRTTSGSGCGMVSTASRMPGRSSTRRCRPRSWSRPNGCSRTPAPTASCRSTARHRGIASMDRPAPTPRPPRAGSSAWILTRRGGSRVAPTSVNLEWSFLGGPPPSPSPPPPPPTQIPSIAYLL